jgi:hypothetical protein
MSDNRPKGFYISYLEKLHRQREEAGLPPATDIAPQSYWDEWRKNNQMPVDKKAA